MKAILSKASKVFQPPLQY